MHETYEAVTRLATDVIGPDPIAQDWLHRNGVRLERAFRPTRLVHMAGTALKMNAANTFDELRRVARRPDMRGCAGTSEDGAIAALSATPREA